MLIGISVQQSLTHINKELFEVQLRIHFIDNRERVAGMRRRIFLLAARATHDDGPITRVLVQTNFQRRQQGRVKQEIAVSNKIDQPPVDLGRQLEFDDFNLIALGPGPRIIQRDIGRVDFPGQLFDPVLLLPFRLPVEDYEARRFFVAYPFHLSYLFEVGEALPQKSLSIYFSVQPLCSLWLTQSKQ